jgi:hypothetical protein
MTSIVIMRLLTSYLKLKRSELEFDPTSIEID